MLVGDCNPIKNDIIITTELDKDWFSSVVVSTLASHARGSRFDPRLNLLYEIFKKRRKITHVIILL